MNRPIFELYPQSFSFKTNFHSIIHSNYFPRVNSFPPSIHPITFNSPSHPSRRDFCPLSPRFRKPFDCAVSSLAKPKTLTIGISILTRKFHFPLALRREPERGPSGKQRSFGSLPGSCAFFRARAEKGDGRRFSCFRGERVFFRVLASAREVRRPFLPRPSYPFGRHSPICVSGTYSGSKSSAENGDCYCGKWSDSIMCSRV